MTIVRCYLMNATEGNGPTLRQALIDLAAMLAPLPGFEGGELLADRLDADSYVFLERWATIESQEAAGKALGKDGFAAVMACLDRRPEAWTLDAMVRFEARR